MKSMLYVGATLMIGASIYGFVDYKSSSRQKEFAKMYSEETKTNPTPVTVDNKTVAEKTEVKTVAVRTKSARTKNKTVTKETTPVTEIITAREDKKDLVIKELADEVSVIALPVEITTKELPKEETVVVVPDDEKTVTRTIKKKRKLNSKLFSRGALRDEVIEVKESKKKVTKEQ